MKLPLRILLVPCVLLLCVISLCGQEVAVTADDDASSVNDPSPDGRFAFLRARQSVEGDFQKTCDLIEKASKKVLLRVGASDVGSNRFDVSVRWSPDSTRFALFASYNHFGSDLTVYLRTGSTFRQVKLPNISEPDVPGKLKRGYEWKQTNIGDKSSNGWRKDGTLPVRTTSYLYAINSKWVIISERNVVLGFSRSGKVIVLKSRQRVFRCDQDDLSNQSTPFGPRGPLTRYALTHIRVLY